jgi:hypothetical protein
MRELGLNPPAHVQPAQSDAELMDEASRLYGSIVTAERTTLATAARLGGTLDKLKARKPGQWLKTLETLDIHRRLASDYIRLARAWEALPIGEPGSIRECMSIREALWVLGHDEQEGADENDAEEQADGGEHGAEDHGDAGNSSRGHDGLAGSSREERARGKRSYSRARNNGKADRPEIMERLAPKPTNLFPDSSKGNYV